LKKNVSREKQEEKIIFGPLLQTADLNGFDAAKGKHGCDELGLCF